MSEPKTSLEIIAPTVEEAILRGSIELGLPAKDLEVQILDEGSKGFLGLGIRQVRVRLSIKTQIEAQQSVREEDEFLEAFAAEEQVPEGEHLPEGEDQEAVASTFETISELLGHMGIDAQIEIRWGAKDDSNRACPLLVELRGKDLSILIGRRAETLSSLQYITRLIVGKKLHRPIPIVIDVEGYRTRRERQLRQLARRMAQQAIERGRTMTLEPMPANERRIIHIELRDHPQVYTESIGEGDRRKITIKLRR